MGFLPRGYSHLFVLPAEGGTPRQVTRGDFMHGGPGPRGVREAVWTPDGRSLLISANRRDDAQLEILDTEIWEVDVARGEMRALTDRLGPDDEPALSPDGGRIAYTGWDERYQGYQLRRLYVMNRDGSGRSLLTGKLDRSVSGPR